MYCIASILCLVELFCAIVLHTSPLYVVQCSSHSMLFTGHSSLAHFMSHGSSVQFSFNAVHRSQ